MHLYQEWMKDGLCRTLSAEVIKTYFFAEEGMKGNHAKKFCKVCPVRIQCRDFGLVQPVADCYGIWGGLNQADREYYHREVPELIEELRSRLHVRAEDFEFEPPDEPPMTPASIQVDFLSSILQELGLTPLELPMVLSLTV